MDSLTTSDRLGLLTAAVKNVTFSDLKSTGVVRMVPELSPTTLKLLNLFVVTVVSSIYQSVVDVIEFGRWF